MDDEINPEVLHQNQREKMAKATLATYSKVEPLSQPEVSTPMNASSQIQARNKA
jgi:hypothetical protein